MPEHINDANKCWCGCELPARSGSFFRPGHDRFAESAVIHMVWGGIREFIEAHGYSPSGKNLHKAFEEWQRHGGGEAVKGRRKGLGIVLQDGKPAAVILDINQYREMLERLEDVEDIKVLDEMRKKSLGFRKLEEFLEEYTPGP